MVDLNIPPQVMSDAIFCITVIIISIAVSLISSIIIRRHETSAWIHIVKIAFAPGVIVHELSHLIVCKLFGVEILDFTLFQADTISGSIQPINLDNKSPLQLFYIAFAPTFTGTIILYYLFPLVSSPFTSNLSLLAYIGVAYLFISVLVSLHISAEDFGVFFRSFSSANTFRLIRDIVIAVLSIVCTLYFAQSFPSLIILTGISIGFQLIFALILKTLGLIMQFGKNRMRTRTNIKNNRGSKARIPEPFKNKEEKEASIASKYAKIAKNDISDLFDSSL